MNIYADKRQENKRKSPANADSQKQISGASILQFMDNRPEVIAQQKLQEIANNKRIAQLMLFSNKVIQKNGDESGYEADIEDNIPLTFKSLEALLNEKLGNHWCYVGGYACNLWFKNYDLPGDQIGDIEIAVNGNKIEEINNELRIEFGYSQDESPEINGLTLTIFSGNEDEGERIGTANVLKPEKLISIYERALLGAAMKERFGTITPEEMEKKQKRTTRVSNLKKIMELRT